MKRKPIIYLAGSCKSKILTDIKNDINKHDFGKPVTFLDPAKFKPNRIEYESIEKVNNDAMSISDLMVSIINNDCKAGTGIEMYIYNKILKKPILLITNLASHELTPRIRGLIEIHSSVFETTSKIQEWIDNWYNE